MPDTRPFKSKVEEYFYLVGASAIAGLHEFDGYVADQMTYEAVRLAVPGGFYTIDFFLILSNKQNHDEKILVLIETKGDRKQTGYRTTRQRLLDVASLYPVFVFIEAIVKKDRRIGYYLYELEFVTKSPFIHVVYPQIVTKKVGA